MTQADTPERKKRGRPPKKRKIADRIHEYCERTGDSRATAYRKMASGHLRFIQEGPGCTRKIPRSEYRRLGYGDITDD
jgi:hypothetical protein